MYYTEPQLHILIRALQRSTTREREVPSARLSDANMHPHARMLRCSLLRADFAERL